MSSRWVAVTALCAGVAAGLCGCSNNAHLVRWDGSSGVVAIPHNDNDWPDKNREHAEAVMKEKCPNGYTIVAEQEVTVGGTVDHTVTRVGYMRVRETSYHPQQEWHITFRSNDAPPASLLTPPPPGIPAPLIQTSAVVPAPPPVAAPAPPPGLPPAPIPVGP
jgi:hypothetical protein